MSGLDFIWLLQDIADTIGDRDDSDVVLTFWRKYQLFIRAEFVRTGFEPWDLTLWVTPN